MRLYVALALFEGCSRETLNDADRLRSILNEAVRAGAFTLMNLSVVPFQPEGVTACAIVGESHLALHSWPQEGRLFVDIASCSTLDSVRDALEAIRDALPEARLTVLDERVIAPPGAAAEVA